MHAIVTRAYRALVPLRLRELRADWIRRRALEATNRLRTASQCLVQSGPLAGMKYLPSAHHSELGPKLLGTYEMEVAHLFSEMVGGRFGRMIDIGAAEGYYACGACFLNGDLEVIAFEASASARAELRRLLALNGVEGNVRIEGTCSPDSLAPFLRHTRPTCLLVDIDGGELDLLDPALLPELRSVTILVELHDFIDPRISSTLLHRFAPSHSIDRIETRMRLPGQLPRVAGLGLLDRMMAAREARGGRQAWLWMEPLPGTNV